MARLFVLKSHELFAKNLYVQKFDAILIFDGCVAADILPKFLCFGN